MFQEIHLRNYNAGSTFRGDINYIDCQAPGLISFLRALGLDGTARTFSHQPLVFGAGSLPRQGSRSRQIILRISIARIQAHNLPELNNRIVKPPLLHEGIAKTIVRITIVRSIFQSFFELSGRSIDLAFL